MNNKPTETQQKTKAIYYWLDGYWITDKEEAELMDEINAFGSKHGVICVSTDVDSSFIDLIVSEQLEGCENHAITTNL